MEFLGSLFYSLFCICSVKLYQRFDPRGIISVWIILNGGYKKMKSDLPGLDKLVREIFKIIPSYYDDFEAKKIKKLIIEYIETLK